MHLKIAMAQMDVKSSDMHANMEKMHDLVCKAAELKSDIVVFPELWSTGFNWQYNLNHIDEYHNSLNEVFSLARRYGIWFCGSMLLPNKHGKLSNTAILVDSQGLSICAYEKIHLFPPMMEERYLEPGHHLTTANIAWAKVGFAICYDLRFPELFVSYALHGVKIVFLPASFPSPRQEHWKVLLKARAIENQMVMVGVNRVGYDLMECGDKISYFGNSLLVDPTGSIVAEGPNDEEQLIYADIDMDLVNQTRQPLHYLHHRRTDAYKNIKTDENQLIDSDNHY
ncbi:MAG: nitrilase-related carbon-nitrogen hydrolase [Chlamydiota bacterium]|nr:nitrilase-related carbon-nitrogen hydrolase [Chlamydiota bacterium]